MRRIEVLDLDAFGGDIGACNEVIMEEWVAKWMDFSGREGILDEIGAWWVKMGYLMDRRKEGKFRTGHGNGNGNQHSIVERVFTLRSWHTWISRQYGGI
jgi:hypothetical protein